MYLQLQLYPVSQLMKRFNQNIDRGS